MSGSIFKDKSVKPDTRAFAETIGETAGYWKELRNGLEDEFG